MMLDVHSKPVSWLQKKNMYFCALMLTSMFAQTFSTQQVFAQSPFLTGDTKTSMMQGNIETQNQDVNILFLIDASYSMKEKFGGADRKMGAAKQVIEQAIAMIPASVNVGLRVFGQSFSGAAEIDCLQTYMLVPLGKHNRGSLITAVRTVQPSGLTPLEFALRRCAEEDFARAQGTKTIILISDGLDTCGGNPCEYMQQLGRYGIKIRCDVVGLELKRDRKAQDQLNCLAEATGGKYYDASTAGDLIQSVAHSVKQAISGKVMIKPSAPKPPAEAAPEGTFTPSTRPTPSILSAPGAPNSPLMPGAMKLLNGPAMAPSTPAVSTDGK